MTHPCKHAGSTQLDELRLTWGRTPSGGVWLKSCGTFEAGTCCRKMLGERVCGGAVLSGPQNYSSAHPPAKNMSGPQRCAGGGCFAFFTNFWGAFSNCSAGQATQHPLEGLVRILRGPRLCVPEVPQATRPTIRIWIWHLNSKAECVYQLSDESLVAPLEHKALPSGRRATPRSPGLLNNWKKPSRN